MRYRRAATGPLPTNGSPPARIHAQVAPERVRLGSGTKEQVNDFLVPAALPATMSETSTDMPAGKKNLHCSAAGALPAPDSNLSRKDPAPPGRAVVSGIDKDWAEVCME